MLTGGSGTDPTECFLWVRLCSTKLSRARFWRNLCVCLKEKAHCAASCFALLPAALRRGILRILLVHQFNVGSETDLAKTTPSSDGVQLFHPMLWEWLIGALAESAEKGLPDMWKRSSLCLFLVRNKLDPDKLVLLLRCHGSEKEENSKERVTCCFSWEKEGREMAGVRSGTGKIGLESWKKRSTSDENVCPVHCRNLKTQILKIDLKK